MHGVRDRRSWRLAERGMVSKKSCKAHDRLARRVRSCCFAHGVTNGDVRAAAFLFICGVAELDINESKVPHSLPLQASTTARPLHPRY